MPVDQPVSYKTKSAADCPAQSLLRMMGGLSSVLNRLRRGRAHSALSLDSNLSGAAKGSGNWVCQKLPPFMVKTNDLTSTDTDFSKLTVPANLHLDKRQLFRLIKSWKVMRRQQNIKKAGVEMFVT
ncbi:hypothetical protein PoB_004360800 [Plakobranchus ocellatus]|uniref:Uncharacterized protein n=1 Tax=Plakobranchus ocellatus TaxID=259542 RepID=A0AAV4BD48_9GAST|nr:hypothetical protein PoB_004360800 [Plakobranchus ocellatus]